MAAMILKDVLVCPMCGENMYPCSFDKNRRRIGYRCWDEDCDLDMEFSFEDARLEEGERPQFFSLNDDGVVTWKCPVHGSCDNIIENLMDEDLTKFERCCCVWGRDEEELEADAEYAQGEGKETITKILDAIGEDQVEELAEDMICENDLDDFGGDYVAAFVAEALCNEDGVDDFIYLMINRIYDLFEISVNEDGEILDEE